MSSNPLLWIGFIFFIFLMLALDLGVFHRKAHEIRFKEAIYWSLTWISLAMLFNLGLYLWAGKEAALQFLTGYLIEKSLSIDNLFLFLTIFSAFRVPPLYQHKILFWGIVGALVMRACFIFAGIELIHRFHWMLYVFGGFLVVTGAQMALKQGDKKKDYRNSLLVRLAVRFLPFTDQYDSGRFMIHKNGKRLATPLFLVLLLIEATDLVFAIDSIPAILAVTQEPFLVFTSNVFAILGLRSLYFALAGFARMFAFLHYGLAAILVFVGVKMLLVDVYKIPTPVSLAVIVGLLSVSCLISIRAARKERERPRSRSAA